MKLLSDQFTAKLKWLSPYFLNRTFLPELSNPRFLKKPFLFVTLKLTKGCYNSKAWPKANPKKTQRILLKKWELFRRWFSEQNTKRRLASSPASLHNFRLICPDFFPIRSSSKFPEVCSLRGSWRRGFLTQSATQFEYIFRMASSTSINKFILLD